MGFATDAIHGGDGYDDETGAVTPPIHLSTTFARRSVENGHTHATTTPQESTLRSLSPVSKEAATV